MVTFGVTHAPACRPHLYSLVGSPNSLIFRINSGALVDSDFESVGPYGVGVDIAQSPLSPHFNGDILMIPGSFQNLGSLRRSAIIL